MSLYTYPERTVRINEWMFHCNKISSRHFKGLSLCLLLILLGLFVNSWGGIRLKFYYNKKNVGSVLFKHTPTFSIEPLLVLSYD